MNRLHELTRYRAWLIKIFLNVVKIASIMLVGLWGFFWYISGSFTGFPRFAWTYCVTTQKFMEVPQKKDLLDRKSVV